ncbi:hypothetical protein BWQ96_05522 [Gracilariopsis chorda]|uniref:Uncharacterized protein n=1 Tax=Gracilariopsis chorda TaxID=448386 RepID=A0A2V3IRB2_9FLOR|nr:hypothetical protein BWQ96_05522 [Gracilariopsis chorda]|eukprot:PXF44665.1 hypothetical protein BWQ96_05522 [Gracilariopsis chorda]
MQPWLQRTKNKQVQNGNGSSKRDADAEVRPRDESRVTDALFSRGESFWDFSSFHGEEGENGTGSEGRTTSAIASATKSEHSGNGESMTDSRREQRCSHGKNIGHGACLRSDCSATGCGKSKGSARNSGSGSKERSADSESVVCSRSGQRSSRGKSDGSGSCPRSRVSACDSQTSRCSGKSPRLGAPSCRVSRGTGCSSCVNAAEEEHISACEEGACALHGETRMPNVQLDRGGATHLGAGASRTDKDTGRRRSAIRLNMDQADELYDMVRNEARQTRLSAPTRVMHATGGVVVMSDRERTTRRPESARSTTETKGKGLGSGWCVALSAVGMGIARRKVIGWGPGIRPKVVFASCEEEGDGDKARLTATLLPRMSTQHRAWETVGDGGFVIRVLGSWLGREGTADVWTRCNGRMIHARRCGRGWRAVRGEREVARGRGGERVTALWVGIERDGQEEVSGELRFRVAHSTTEGASVADGASVAMRFGYYFVVGGGGGTRFFASIDTPEQVRLVARRVDGAIDERISRGVSYVVLHVAAAN